MFKKISIILFVVVLAGVFLYFYSRPRLNKEEKTYNDIQTTNPTVVLKTNETAPTPASNQRIIKTPDKNFDEYDKNEQEWLSKIENILGQNDYEYYLDLRKKNDEEKMKAYKEFHDYLRQKHGDNFSYNISEDQGIREKEINTRNTRDLLNRIGEEKFKLYLKTRDEFNAELLKKSENGSALVIEF